MAGNDDLDEGQRALSDGESVAVPSRDGSDSDDGAPKLPPAVRKLADTLSSGERDGAPSTAGLDSDAPRRRRQCAPVPKTPRPPRREGKAPPPKRARRAQGRRRAAGRAAGTAGLAACKMDWFRRQQRRRDGVAVGLGRRGSRGGGRRRLGPRQRARPRRNRNRRSVGCVVARSTRRSTRSRSCLSKATSTRSNTSRTRARGADTSYSLGGSR